MFPNFVTGSAAQDFEDMADEMRIRTETIKVFLVRIRFT